MTATQKFIEDALNGEWKPKQIDYPNVCLDEISKDRKTVMFNNCESDSDLNYQT